MARRGKNADIGALKADEGAALLDAVPAGHRVVALDEREGGIRAILNLGHTFGHAIETGVGYGEWLHGEAVGTGMLMAADLSARHQWLARSDVERIENLLRRAGLPTTPPVEMDESQFKELMAIDKKVVDGGLRLVLLKEIGGAVITGDFSAALLSQTLARTARAP